MPSILLIFIRFVLALGAGLLLSLAYAPTDYGWLAWFFPAVLLALIWTLPKRGGKKDFWHGFGIAYIAGFGFWVRDVSFVGAVSQQGGWASSGGLALYLSLYFGLYGGWAATVGRFKPIKPKSQPAFDILRLSALHGLLWCGLEWVRGLSRMSFGWDGLGVSFLESGFVLAQAADIVGVNGLSFIPVFGGAVLLQTLVSFHVEAQHGHRRPHWEVIFTMTFLCLTFLYGAVRLKGLHAEEKFELNTLLVQQNVPLSYSWDADRAQEIYEGFAGEMRIAFESVEEEALKSLQEYGEAKIRTPDLVIWPESSLPNPLWVLPDGAPAEEQENALFYDESIRPLGDFLFITGVNQFPLIDNGVGEYVTDKEGAFYNAIGFFPAGFESYDFRGKNHLMPFGEYMPFEWFPLFKLAYEYSAGQTWGGAFHPATEFEPYPTEVKGNAFSIIPTVCYEDSVSVLVRKYIKHEPQLIVNVTNDGWFAGTSCAEKHFQNARFRAIEYRRPLVRSSNTGVSGVVNFTGAFLHPETNQPQWICDEAGSFEVKDSLNGLVEIPKTVVVTIYSVIGDVFCWGGGLVTIGYTVIVILAGRKKNTSI